MTELTYGSLCSGYSGLDSGVQSVLGGRTVWVSEFDDDASRVLDYHWSDVPNLGDLTATDWTRVPPVDVITAGFPCQPFSHAGLRLGANDPRHLWPHISHAIGVLRPRLVVLENVRGLLSGQGEPDTPDVARLADEADRLGRILTLIDHKKAKATRRGQADRIGRLKADTHRITQRRRPVVVALRRARRRIIRAIGAVLRDLANHGYDAQWHGIRASDVGGAHGRFRVFIFATPRDADLTGLEGRGPSRRADEWSPREASLGPVAHVPGQLTLLPTPTTSDTNGAGLHGTGGPDLRTVVHQLTEGDYAATDQADADEGMRRVRTGVPTTPVPGEVGRLRRLHEAPQLLSSLREHETGSREGHPPLAGEETPREGMPGLPSNDGPTRSSRRPERDEQRPDELGDALCELSLETALAGGQGCSYGCGETCSGHNRGAWGEYEAAIRRWEVCIGRPSPDPTTLSATGSPRLSAKFTEWMMGLPAGHVTNPAIWVGKTPSAARNAQLKILGNGVVPPQAAAATRLWLGQPLPTIDPPADLLPTPTVNDMGAAYTPDTWDAWTDRMKTAHGNGNGHGKSLSIEALRLQTTSTNH